MRSMRNGGSFLHLFTSQPTSDVEIGNSIWELAYFNHINLNEEPDVRCHLVSLLLTHDASFMARNWSCLVSSSSPSQLPARQSNPSAAPPALAHSWNCYWCEFQNDSGQVCHRCNSERNGIKPASKLALAMLRGKRE